MMTVADTYGHLFPRTDDGKELAAAEKRFLFSPLTCGAAVRLSYRNSLR